MKKIFCLSLVVLVMAFSGGPAVGQPPDAEELLALKQGSFQSTTETCLPNPEPKKPADDASYQKDKDKTKKKPDKIDDIVKKKMDEKCWEQPRYCRPLFNFWCQQICGSVSPCKPGGSKRWGWKCNPGLLSKCERCGFL